MATIRTKKLRKMPRAITKEKCNLPKLDTYTDVSSEIGAIKNISPLPLTSNKFDEMHIKNIMKTAYKMNPNDRKRKSHMQACDIDFKEDFNTIFSRKRSDLILEERESISNWNDQDAVNDRYLKRRDLCLSPNIQNHKDLVYSSKH